MNRVFASVHGMLIRQPRFWLCIAFGLILIGQAIIAHYRSIRERETPFGSLTMEQVLARSEPLCRLLAPPPARPRLTAYRFSDSTRRAWSVTCEDEDRRYIAEIFWDADSGEIRKVCCKPSGIASRNAAPLDGDLVIRVAVQWLHDLGFASSESELRQLGAPQRLSGGHCIVRFYSDSKIAVVRLHVRSGNLLSVEQWQRQSGSLDGI